MDPCPHVAHAWGMDQKEQGKLLRAWRHHMSDRRGTRITLMSLAGEVAEAAEKLGHKPSSRKIPGSHASMTRWELGDVEQSLQGLQIIADIYGVTMQDLMRAPPTDQAPTAKANDDVVEAFRQFLATRGQR